MAQLRTAWDNRGQGRLLLVLHSYWLIVNLRSLIDIQVCVLIFCFTLFEVPFPLDDNFLFLYFKVWSTFLPNHSIPFPPPPAHSAMEWRGVHKLSSSSLDVHGGWPGWATRLSFQNHWSIIFQLLILRYFHFPDSQVCTCVDMVVWPGRETRLTTFSQWFLNFFANFFCFPIFLAVQDSSIGDLVTHSLTH